MKSLHLLSASRHLVSSRQGILSTRVNTFCNTCAISLTFTRPGEALVRLGTRNYVQFARLQQFHTGSRLEDCFKVQDEDDFNKRVLKSKKPVIVQFHATWCGPCKMLAPRMEKAIAAAKDGVDLAQVDIEDCPDIAMSYSVGAVPAVMAVKDGKVVDKFIGLKDEDQIDTFVAKLLQ